jgi:hypothetical protein
MEALRQINHPENNAHEHLVQQAYQILEAREVFTFRGFTAVVRRERERMRVDFLRNMSSEKLQEIIDKKFSVLTVVSGLTRTEIVKKLSKYCPDIKCISQENDTLILTVPVTCHFNAVNWRTWCFVEKINFVSFQ